MINFHGHFVWYELITTNVEAAKVFYTRVMGWGVRDASTPGRTYILFTAGEALVSGLMDLPDTATQTGGTPFWIGYVGVNDVDAAAELRVLPAHAPASFERVTRVGVRHANHSSLKGRSLALVNQAPAIGET